MKIDYSDFLEHLISNFIKNDNKLQSHLQSSNYDFNLIEFIKYMLDNEPDSYKFYLNSIKHYHRLYDCKDISGDDINTFAKLIDEFSKANLIKIIFLNETLITSLKNYFKYNPIKTLASIPYFKKALVESISPYIQEFNGIVFFDNDDKLPNLYINPPCNSNCEPHSSDNLNKNIILNQFYLENVLSFFIEKSILEYDYFPLIVEIKNNIIKFSYSKFQSKAMLVNKVDFDSVLKSFSFSDKKENSTILKSFLSEEIPYDFVVLYLNNINKYIDIETKKPKEWVTKQFEEIKYNSYFKKIANDYSIPFSVFVHSIYPCGDINEFLKDASKSKTASYDEYSIFSFLTWIYKKKNGLL